MGFKTRPLSRWMGCGGGGMSINNSSVKFCPTCKEKTWHDGYGRCIDCRDKQSKKEVQEFLNENNK